MAGIEDRFPEGLRVLVVDDNLTCLKILELLLQRCNYKVTGTQEATKALKMLTENPKNYDIVISDVHMPGMDGFQLLENIGLFLDIPVIMLSANDDYTQVMRGIKHGAVDYLIKPVMEKELKNIWKHVAMRKQLDKIKGKAIADEKEDGGADQSNVGKSTSLDPEQETRKRKDSTDDGDDEDGQKNDNHGLSVTKRKRMVWTPDLHKKFVNVVDQLGENHAFPKKILERMNVEGLTRDNVASHLQKYKIYLKRMTYAKTMGHYTDPTFTPFGARESSLFRPGGAMFNTNVPYTNIESSLSNNSMGLLSSFHPNTTNGSVLEQLTTHPSNPGNDIRCRSQVTIGWPSTQGVERLPNPPSLPPQYSGYMAQSGIPSLQDYTRCTENWPYNNVTPATIQQNQAPPTDPNGRVSSTDISHLRDALEYTSMDMHNVSQSRRFNALELQEYRGDPKILVATSNIGEQSNQFAERSSIPSRAFANPTYGQVVGIGTSSGLQNTEAQAPPPEDELDALLNMDLNDLLDHEPDLLNKFLGNDNNL